MFGIFVYLASSGGLGWVFNVIAIIAALFFLVLIGLSISARVVSRNVITGTCGNCGTAFQALKGKETRCPACGSGVIPEEDGGVFRRASASFGGDAGPGSAGPAGGAGAAQRAPAGTPERGETIDVEVIDVEPIDKEKRK